MLLTCVRGVFGSILRLVTILSHVLRGFPLHSQANTDTVNWKRSHPLPSTLPFINHPTTRNYIQGDSYGKDHGLIIMNHNNLLMKTKFGDYIYLCRCGNNWDTEPLKLVPSAWKHTSTARSMFRESCSQHDNKDCRNFAGDWNAANRPRRYCVSVAVNCCVIYNY
jgi:hypothetical protein